jgi:hypothetical protein
MARIVRGWGCAQHFGYDNGPRDRNLTACSRRHSDRLANVQVFGVAYADGPPALQRQGDIIGAGINITTVIKTAPGCRGHIRRRTCALRQATVEYDVRLTNDSIALRGTSGSSNASFSADNTTTTGDSSATGPGWQPKQDRFVTDTPADTVGMSNWWTKLFPLLVPPVQVNLTHLTMATLMQFERYLDCRDGQEAFRASNTSCSMPNTVLLRDLALEYVVEPYNLSATPGSSLRTGEMAPPAAKVHQEAQCAIHWRDPMQVRMARPTANDFTYINFLCFFCTMQICPSKHPFRYSPVRSLSLALFRTLSFPSISNALLLNQFLMGSAKTSSQSWPHFLLHALVFCPLQSAFPHLLLCRYTLRRTSGVKKKPSFIKNKLEEPRNHSRSYRLFFPQPQEH